MAILARSSLQNLLMLTSYTGMCLESFNIKGPRIGAWMLSYTVCDARDCQIDWAVHQRVYYDAKYIEHLNNTYCMNDHIRSTK